MKVGGECGEGSHAYNQGRTIAIVISKNPLPSYRPDLDEREDNSTQRQVAFPEYDFESIAIEMVDSFDSQLKIRLTFDGCFEILDSHGWIRFTSRNG